MLFELCFTCFDSFLLHVKRKDQRNAQHLLCVRLWITFEGTSLFEKGQENSPKICSEEQVESTHTQTGILPSRGSAICVQHFDDSLIQQFA
jgi:hypothetical protein